MATGINFRATSGFVTDDASETYSLGEAYPTSRGGMTFGWDVSLAVNARNRASGNDRRLAGCVFTNNTSRYFRIDLAATGSWTISCAGNEQGSNNGSRWDLQDQTTVIQSLTGDLMSGNTYKDATDTLRTHASWVSSNASTTYNFTTTEFRFKCRQAATNNNAVAHIRIEQNAAAFTHDALGVLRFTGLAHVTANYDDSTSPGKALAGGRLLFTGVGRIETRYVEIVGGAISFTGLSAAKVSGVWDATGRLTITGLASSAESGVSHYSHNGSGRLLFIPSCHATVGFYQVAVGSLLLSGIAPGSSYAILEVSGEGRLLIVGLVELDHITGHYLASGQLRLSGLALSRRDVDSSNIHCIGGRVSVFPAVGGTVEVYPAVGGTVEMCQDSICNELY